MNKFPKIGLLALAVLTGFSANAQNTFPATGNVGIGTTAPTSILNLVTQGSLQANHNSQFDAFSGTVAGTGAGTAQFTCSQFNMRKARGTRTAPTTVVNGDRLSTIVTNGYDGTTYQSSAQISFFADGVVSSGNVPMSMVFMTGTNPTNRADRLTVASSGTVRIHNLSGTGTRMVVADANGILSTQAIPTGGGGSTSDYWSNSAGAAPDGTNDGTETIKRDGAVGIGTSTPDAAARLHVVDGGTVTTNRYAILAEQTSSGNCDSTYVGISGNSVGTCGDRIGVEAYAASDSISIGILAQGTTWSEFNIGDAYTGGGMYIVDAAGVNDQTLYVENTSDSNLSGYDYIGTFSYAKGGQSWGIGSYSQGGWIGSYGAAVDSLNNDYWLAGGYFVGRNRGAATQSAYGVRAVANHGAASGTAAAYGVYGSATTGGTWAGNGSATNTNAWAIYANGRAYSTSGTWSGSDARLKTNIKNVGNAMDIISRLQPKTYEYRHDGKFAQCNFANGTQYGFLAQELEQVIPEMVTDVQMPFNSEDEDKTNDYTEVYKAVNYDALIPVLTKGMQEQQAVIEKQNETITSLQNEIAAIKAALSQAGVQLPQSGTVGAAGTETQLFQNVPNPFDGTTTIPYFINQNATSAKVVITNAATGQVAQTFEVATKGAGQLRVSAAGMSSGTYTYSLIVDGQLVASKAMVLTK